MKKIFNYSLSNLIKIPFKVLLIKWLNKKWKYSHDLCLKTMKILKINIFTNFSILKPKFLLIKNTKFIIKKKILIIKKIAKKNEQNIYILTYQIITYQSYNKYTHYALSNSTIINHLNTLKNLSNTFTKQFYSTCQTYL